jgi:hypothetical protein
MADPARLDITKWIMSLTHILCQSNYDKYLLDIILHCTPIMSTTAFTFLNRFHATVNGNKTQVIAF